MKTMWQTWEKSSWVGANRVALSAADMEASWRWACPKTLMGNGYHLWQTLVEELVCLSLTIPVWSWLPLLSFPYTQSALLHSSQFWDVPIESGGVLGTLKSQSVGSPHRTQCSSGSVDCLHLELRSSTAFPLLPRGSLHVSSFRLFLVLAARLHGRWVSSVTPQFSVFQNTTLVPFLSEMSIQSPQHRPEALWFILCSVRLTYFGKEMLKNAV